jgi:hypothetical protein
MELAFQYYVEDYCNALGASSDPPIPGTDLARCIGDLTEGEMDLGVGHLKGWTSEQVWDSLGLQGATQFPFGEPGTRFPPELCQPSKPKAEPRWHQVIGVHAILEGAFTKQLRERSRPTVLCDDVGLGKTLQIIGIFSMLSHLYEQQLLGKERRLPLPPFTIGKSKISDLFWGL